MPLYEGIGTITDKLVTVIDIGAAYTKLGFSGEFSPRCIIRSEVKCKDTGVVRNIRDYKNAEDLYDLLVEFVHMLYFKYALLSPKDRPVIIVESLLCPTIFRETLAKVLFCHYEVSIMLVLPSHLVSLASLAVDTALVLDVGYTEAVVIPVCHGLPVIHAWQALPIASQAIHESLKSLLTACNTGVSSISEWTLEDIKVRCCFVTTQARAEECTKATPEITLCPEVEYPLAGSKILKIPGKIRETVYEIFFEEDNDHQCMSTMILDVILKVNVDLRIKLAENIVITGGTSMAPGFKSRLKDELYKQLKSDRYSKLKITKFKFHNPPSKENYTSWLGGAIYGCTELLSMKGLSRENYLKEGRLPDWANMKDNIKTFWPKGKDLHNFGERDIKLLPQHFANCLAVEEDDITHILEEWCFFMKDRFPYLANLLAIVLTLPVSTSSYERGFSTMNIIKNKLCSNLKQDSINSLTFINLYGPSLKDFNLEKSIDKWYFKVKSQRNC